MVRYIWHFLTRRETYYAVTQFQHDVHNTGNLSNAVYCRHPQLHHDLDKHFIIDDNLNSGILKSTHKSKPGNLSERILLAIAKVRSVKRRKYVP